MAVSTVGVSLLVAGCWSKNECGNGTCDYRGRGPAGSTAKYVGRKHKTYSNSSGKVVTFFTESLSINRVPEIFDPCSRILGA